MSAHCGTPQGIDTHKNRNEPPCPPCKVLMGKLTKGYKPRVQRATGAPRNSKGRAPRKSRATSPRKPRDHGTTARYQQHLRDGDEPCAPCRKATADYKKARRVRKGRKLSPCGTHAAYKRHKRYGEIPDEACLEAYKESNKAMWLEKKATREREDQRQKSGSNATVNA